jgi:hypothetical protein
VAEGLERLIDVARRHVEAETAGDLDGTMATLEDHVYDLWPVGLRLEGRDAVARYYRSFFDRFMPTVAGYRLHREWVGEGGLAQEYTIEVRLPEGGTEAFRLLGILDFGRNALKGETFYGSERFLRILVGDAWDTLRPIVT